jgi:hypothetical protein
MDRGSRWRGAASASFTYGMRRRHRMNPGGSCRGAAARDAFCAFGLLLRLDGFSLRSARDQRGPKHSPGESLLSEAT